MSEKIQDLKSVIRAFRLIAETYERVADHLETQQPEVQTDVGSQQDQLKSQVLAMIAHEIRTSLTVLKGTLYILLFEEPVDAETRRTFLTRAHDHVEKLTALMSDCLMWIPK